MPGVFFEVGFGRQRAGRCYKVTGTSIRVGNAPACTLRIASSRVSPEHLLLHLAHGRWLARNLSTDSCTLLDAEPVAEAEIRTGSVLRLGERGPSVRVLGLDPPPAAQRARPRTVARGHAAPRAAPAGAIEKRARNAPHAHTRRRATWMVGAGILLGIAVGLELLGAGFPYGIAAAPCLWLARGCLALFPTYAAAKLGWILVVSLGAYGGAVGAALHAPLRRWPLLLLLAQLHVVAGFALGRFGL